VFAQAMLEPAPAAGLVAFGMADTHPHAVAVCSREQIGRYVHAVEVRLHFRLRLESPLELDFTRDICTTSHLYSALRYALKQPERHGVDPRIDLRREASSLPDALGLRPLGGVIRANLDQHAPRLSRTELLAIYGLRELRPADGPLEQSSEAVLAAAALPRFSRSPAGRAARRAVVELADGRASHATVGSWIGLTERAVYLLRKLPVDTALVAAARLQLDLISQLQQSPR